MKIFCIGRNYIDHAKELNNPVPSQPLVFMKPATALLKDNRDFFYPDFTQDLHYEAEIVLRICKNGKHVQPQFAHKYFDKITIGIDFTARDLQNKCKAKSHPWEIAKGFDHSAPVGQWIDIAEKNLNALPFSLKKNGATVQNGNTSDMIFPFDQLIAHISKFFTLQNGDFIFTGTPAGVGPVQVGDQLEGFIDGAPLLNFQIK